MARPRTKPPCKFVTCRIDAALIAEVDRLVANRSQAIDEGLRLWLELQQATAAELPHANAPKSSC